MKFLYNALFVLLLTCISTATFAQLQVGGGLAYGTEVEAIGIQARGVYKFTEEWGAEADFIFYFDEFEDVTFWELNANGNYFFFSNEAIDAYALAGLNIASVGVSIDLGPFGGTVSESNTEVGLNIGGGVQFGITESIKGLGEIKYIIGDFDQLVLAVGVLFDIGG